VSSVAGGLGRLAGRRRLAVSRPNAAAVAGAFIGSCVVVAVLAPVLAPYDPSEIDLSSVYAASSSSHPLGTDGSGRDTLSRLIWGSRSALLGPLAIVAISGTIGCLIAIAAAWLRGWFDTIASRALDVIFAFPGILLALIGVAVLGSGLPAAIGALSIAYVPYIARILRGEGMRQASQPYVQSARINGFSGVAIAARHLVPNLLPLIVAQMTLSFGYAMVDLASISYLGLGVQAPSADWGLMVQEGQAGVLEGHPQQSLLAGGLIVAVVVSFTIIGDHLSARYEDRGT